MPSFTRCCKYPDRIVGFRNETIFKRSPYLYENFAFEEIKNKTYRELGFYTLTSDEYEALNIYNNTKLHE
jgi:hypothetical protein